MSINENNKNENENNKNEILINNTRSKKEVIKNILISGGLFILICLGIFGAGCGGSLLFDIIIVDYIVMIFCICISIYLCILFGKRFSLQTFNINIKNFSILGKIIYILFILFWIITGSILALCGAIGLFYY